MCGIFGAVSNFGLTKEDKAFLADAAVCDMLRGFHATGIAAITDKTVNIHKKGVNGYDFITQVCDPVKDLGFDVKGVIGHNRWASAGNGPKTDDAGAHPFLQKKIVGVHNGTLAAGWKDRLQVSKKLTVDSDGLFRALANHGLKFVAPRAKGSMALVWVDMESGKVHVIRNAARPLWYVQVNKHNRTTVYYASEPGMLRWLLDRNRIAFRESDKDISFTSTIKPFMANRLYDITDGKVDVGPENEYEMVGKPETNYDQAQYRPGKQQAAKNKTTSNVTNINQGKTQEKKGDAAATPVTAGTSKKSGEVWGTDGGIPYRGPNVPREDLEKGITGEWAERSTSTLQCCCCGGPITRNDNYLEEGNPLDNNSGADVLHEQCLDLYRAEHDAKVELTRILRKPLTNVA